MRLLLDLAIWIIGVCMLDSLSVLLLFSLDRDLVLEVPGPNSVIIDNIVHTIMFRISLTVKLQMCYLNRTVSGCYVVLHSSCVMSTPHYAVIHSSKSQCPFCRIVKREISDIGIGVATSSRRAWSA